MSHLYIHTLTPVPSQFCFFTSLSQKQKWNYFLNNITAQQNKHWTCVQNLCKLHYIFAVLWSHYLIKQGTLTWLIHWSPLSVFYYHKHATAIQLPYINDVNNDPCRMSDNSFGHFWFNKSFGTALYISPSQIGIANFTSNIPTNKSTKYGVCVIHLLQT